MFSSLVTSDGGLTTLGYGISIIIAILAFCIGAYLAGKFSPRKSASAKQLTFCAMALALGFITSYIKFVELPFGGTCTLFSMLFIVLAGWWYGPSTGILVGLTYGILQFLQGPYVLSPLQVCCDYLFAFAALGLSGFFRGFKKYGLIIGYLAAILGRGFFHSLGGYLFWMDYMPESFPKTLSFIYPIVYNYSYILFEGVLTIILISLPPVKRALQQIRKLAVE